MTWKAAHVFCSQQGGHLANSSEVEVIKTKPALVKKQYWLSSAKLKVFSGKDLLQGWYWSDGSLLNTSNGWLQNHNLRIFHNFEKERCAFVSSFKNGNIYWKDDFCDSNLSKRRFICKPSQVRYKILIR